MTQDAQKRDGGKPRYDLIPWGDVETTRNDYSVAEVFAALKVWWTGRPHALDLALPLRQVDGLARVLTMGAAKYAPRGWERGIDFSRVFAAAARHATAYLNGEHIDPESGLSHESHLWANVVFLVVFTRRGLVTLDDRPAATPATAQALARMSALVSQLTGAEPVSLAGLAAPTVKKESN